MLLVEKVNVTSMQHLSSNSTTDDGCYSLCGQGGMMVVATDARDWGMHDRSPCKMFCQDCEEKAQEAGLDIMLARYNGRDVL